MFHYIMWNFKYYFFLKKYAGDKKMKKQISRNLLENMIRVNEKKISELKKMNRKMRLKILLAGE